eukprot:TRINITY_DN16567_c0_g1_i1.p1 TRINITY_DN16567_c0_g1~~TRINITY_DN16567_c0_g1_i1.p1  ORF type:complete len:520 (+),score=145.48 TRINITY_DN16567_c0_g1_i1:84-1643(+)
MQPAATPTPVVSRATAVGGVVGLVLLALALVFAAPRRRCVVVQVDATAAPSHAPPERADQQPARQRAENTGRLRVVDGPAVSIPEDVSKHSLHVLRMGPEDDAEAMAIVRDSLLRAAAAKDLQQYAAHKPAFMSADAWDYYPEPYRRGNLTVYPLAFGAPEELWVGGVPEKTQDFAQSDPRNPGSYKWGASWRGGGSAGGPEMKSIQEAAYYEDYTRSMYAVTMKKKGWDAYRHYEVMATGTLPCFLDIAQAPEKWGALVHQPRQLLLSVLRAPGVDCQAGKLDRRVWNQTLWRAMTHEMLLYGRARLTTRQLARFMLRSAGQSNATSALFVTLGPMGGPYASDYGRDFMLHGFRRLLGYSCVDVAKLPYMYTSSSLEAARFSSRITPHFDGRSGLWGAGFGYSRRLFDSRFINRTGIEERIRKHEFDVVIISDAGTRSSLADDFMLLYHPPVPWINLIREHYKKSEVLLLYASDLLVRRQHAEEMAKIGTLFIREFGGDMDLAPYTQRVFNTKRRRKR